jgi:hypothetical protein
MAGGLLSNKPFQWELPHVAKHIKDMYFAGIIGIHLQIQQ